jgi:hypothetical protein
MHVVCDICDCHVLHTEDSTVLDAIAYGSAVTVFINNPRHIRCSPSRAQYIMHDDFEAIVDDRQAFDKRLLPEEMRVKRENIYTDAWVKLQAEGDF